VWIASSGHQDAAPATADRHRATRIGTEAAHPLSLIMQGAAVRREPFPAIGPRATASAFVDQPTAISRCR
jgi:hypothetical protein